MTDFNREFHNWINKFVEKTSSLVPDPQSFTSCPITKCPAFKDSIYFPRFNLVEKEYCYEYKFDVPGIKKEDIVISENNNKLTIDGHRHEEKEESTAKYHKKESRYGTFSRTLKLRHDANVNDISAKLDKGVLTVTVGKLLTPTSNKKEITIS